MLATSMLTLTDELVGSSAMTTVPEKVPKRPRTLETIMWRTVNPTLVCDASISYVPGSGVGACEVLRL